MPNSPLFARLKQVGKPKLIPVLAGIFYAMKFAGVFT